MLRPSIFLPAVHLPQLPQKTKPGAVIALRVGEVGQSGRRHSRRDLLFSVRKCKRVCAGTVSENRPVELGNCCRFRVEVGLFKR